MLERFLLTVVLALTAAALALLWMLVAQWLGGPVPWMAAVLAADVWIVLLLCRQPAGPRRAALAVAVSAIAALGGLWLQVAATVGGQFGLLPWQSALKLGPVLFVELAAPSIAGASGAWWLLAMAIALASGWLGPSARRRPVP